MRSHFTGLRAWGVQRVSAIYMLFFIVFLLASLGLLQMHDYQQWRAWIARPAMSLAFAAFAAALVAHMWVGLHDVLLDYARPASVRSGLLIAVALGLAGLCVWILLIRGKVREIAAYWSQQQVVSAARQASLGRRPLSGDRNRTSYSRYGSGAACRMSAGFGQMQQFLGVRFRVEPMTARVSLAACRALLPRQCNTHGSRGADEERVCY